MATESRRAYDVHVVGCDASTLITVDLTAAEALLVSGLADKVTEAAHGCDPTMRFGPHLPPQRDDETGREYAARLAGLSAVEPGWTL
jgi:hypothetical protein